MGQAARLRKLPPYLFVELARAKERALAEGREIIDLGVGDPEEPTPARVVRALKRAAENPRHHRYPSSETEADFKRAAAGWLERRYGVRLDPDSELLPLLGTKEGLGHLPLALVDPGETVLVPDPAYPVYRSAALLAGADLRHLKVEEREGFLPRLEDLPEEPGSGVRLLYLNYPNNPTGATCEADFFRRVARWAEQREVVVAHDAAYSEICFDGYRAPSLLSAARPGARVIEFHSLSKSWNMCGWRVGFAAGHPEPVAALRELKANIDSGVFGAVLEAASQALGDPAGPPREVVEEYGRRRDILREALAGAGWVLRRPRATFYLWARPPRASSSAELAARLLARLGVMSTPGVGFGAGGEGYLRFSLTPSTALVMQAAEKLAAVRAEELAAECAPA